MHEKVVFVYEKGSNTSLETELLIPLFIKTHFLHLNSEYLPLSWGSWETEVVGEFKYVKHSHSNYSMLREYSKFK